MPDISDVINSYNTAKHTVDEWSIEFKASFYKPAIDVMISMAIDGAMKDPNVDKKKLMGSLSPKAQEYLRGNNA